MSELPRLPLVIAHRGASLVAPENTIPAFQAAVDAGADGVELDVQVSTDGVCVVFHDLDLKRIAGRDDRVTHLTAEDLAAIDIGKWFAEKRPAANYAGEGIPTLAAVLGVVAEVPGPIYLELKFGDEDPTAAVRRFCEEIKDSPLLSRFIVKSFRLGALALVKQFLPEVSTAALFAPSIKTYLRKKRYILDIAREFGADQVSLHYSLATKKLCGLARERGFPVTVWTADDPKWIERASTRGITAVITNDPSGMLAARDA